MSQSVCCLTVALAQVNLLPKEIYDKNCKHLPKAEPPATVSEVKSFNGLAKYCAKFVPDFASVTDLLWELTRGDKPFEWRHEQQKAFDKVKALITEAPTLVHHPQEVPTRLITDALPVGLGAVLEERQPDGNYRPVCYASRSLTPVEHRYAQFEKEALAVVWGVEHHHLYLLSTHFDILTDHKPLVSALVMALMGSPLPECWDLHWDNSHMITQSDILTDGQMSWTIWAGSRW